MNAPDLGALLSCAPRLRAGGHGDAAAVARFLARMDREGLYERHFAHGEAPNLALLERLRSANGADRYAALALDPTDEVVGHAEYVAEGDSAEFALLVLPEWRDRGVGRALLAELVAAARKNGLDRLHGMVMSTNTRAIVLMRRSGFDLRPGDDRRTVIVSCGLIERPAFRAQNHHGFAALPMETRRHDPDRASLHRCAGA